MGVYFTWHVRLEHVPPLFSLLFIKQNFATPSSSYIPPRNDGYNILLWSSFLLFWLIIGSLFTFWCWFFSISLPYSLIPLRDFKDASYWFSLILTGLFIWSFFGLYCTTNFTYKTLVGTTLLDHLVLPSVVPLLFFLNSSTFPFIYIFLLVTSLAVVFCMCYNRKETSAFYSYVAVIFLAGCFFFTTNSIITFFLAYEMFLIPSFFILYRFAKTRRAIEAAYLMFFWTQFGAMFLLLSFLFVFFSTNSTSWEIIHNYNFTPIECSFLMLCWLVGFGVKLPLWPFYGWLPKAHVEASTNFSIFLSGVLVKFAFFGLLRCLWTLNLDPSWPFIVPFLTMGLVEATFKLFLQIDLKKLVAYATVIEMHWLTICVVSGSSPTLLAGLAMLINHALLSSNAFLLVDAINRRFKTRLITELSGLNLLCPKLFLLSFCNCLLFLGFPGSLSFVSEILFFTYLMDLFPILTLLLILFLYLLAPTFFFRSWFNAMFGMSQFFFKQQPLDLTTREFVSLASLEILIYYLGISWQTLLI